ncbi:AP-1 complex subunit gamma-1 [Protomyces lactucae-debilis]|uniref:AP-1 complex subunit gamma n=1 Tax=Protomyces lactucae-debilis TaxID=2754530 RepID=A0A1Y2FFT7_PROLT|nr:AP-1 complex subunit gamma-1 [Protomyces lactucae-debilis]ORY82156.1 AP-1 complex subunit gamma-1 [Protomyces lactucae-debilis]
MSSLKVFIKTLRATKTASDERAVIQKESAAIRSGFRERPNDHNARRNNVAKLLYLFTLGVPTHFGQIECVKLLASAKFTDKRLGYLGTMLLLDEAQEVLTLVTNSLQHDLQHSNQYIVGLALCTLGNIAGQEMSRDLCSDVSKLLGSTNSYIRKKAALCAMRVIRKVPELEENFLDRAKVLLADRHHGVLLCGLTLATDMCIENPELVPDFVPTLAPLTKVLRSLVTSGFAPEHDVTGVADPFLQVKLIRFFGVLGKGNADVSEQLNDILAQVASNTESQKNVGNSILYETVLTILDIEADTGLRVLGVNILGKFLANKDNNIRYVALNTLNKVIDIEPNAVQRHRATILECLRDPDISIRRRALDLSFALVNEGNVRILIRELLAFLEVANNEFKLSMTTQICICADKYAPNKRWHIDTMLRVLKLAGNFVREEILSSIVRLIATATELHAYVSRKLYIALRQDITQEALTLAGAWTIGEFGDLLMNGGQLEEDEDKPSVPMAARDVVTLLDSILQSTYATPLVCEYILTALIKLTTRFSNSTGVEYIQIILRRYRSSADVEIQQRALEYDHMFEHAQLRKGVLERMPIPEVKEENRVLGPTAKSSKRRKKVVEAENLLDLLGDNAQANVPAPQQPANVDLLQDLFNDGTPSQPTMATPQPNSASADMLDLLSEGQESIASKTTVNSLLDGVSLSNMTLDQQSTRPTSIGAYAPIVALSKHDLELTFEPSRDKNSSDTVRLLARFSNHGEDITQLALQAAVPRSMKLQIQALSSTSLQHGETAIQVLRVTATPGVRIKLRLKLSFSRGAQNITEQADFSNLPATL